jgi:hypothetical protein
MVDPASATMALRDPLSTTLLVFGLGALLVHILFRRNGLARPISRVVALAVLTVVLLQAVVARHQPPVLSGVPQAEAVRAALKVAWIPACAGMTG